MQVPPALRRRFWPEATLAVTSAVLAVVTLLWKDWIEIGFGVDPDGGNGALEWSIVAGLLLLAVASGAFACAELVRASRQPV
jgi:hypothetical protein